MLLVLFACYVSAVRSPAHVALYEQFSTYFVLVVLPSLPPGPNLLSTISSFPHARGAVLTVGHD